VRRHSHEGVDEARNFRRAGDLFGDTPLPTYRKASQVRDKGLRSGDPKAKGAGTPSRGGAGQSRRGLESADEDVTGHFGVSLAASPGARG
jgi:hypothetical protein